MSIVKRLKEGLWFICASFLISVSAFLLVPLIVGEMSAKGLMQVLVILVGYLSCFLGTLAPKRREGQTTSRR